MGQYILSNASYLTYWQDSAQFITPYLLKFSCPGFQDTTYLTALHTPGGSLAFSFPHPSVHKMSKCPRGQSTYLVFIYSHFVMLFHLVTSNIICMPKTLKFRENQDGGVGRHTAPPRTTRTDRESNSKGDQHQGNRK